MRTLRDRRKRDDKKLLGDIRELDRVLQSNFASKNFILKKSSRRQGQTKLNELFAGKRNDNLIDVSSLIIMAVK